MLHKKAKLFWKVNDNPKTIFCIPYDDEQEYYTFLKKCHSDGYRQIILTSEIMVNLIEHFVLEKGLSIYQLEFMEEDEDLKFEVRNLLTAVSENIAYFSKLIDKLNFLSEKSSIDIQRVYFKGRNNKEEAVNFFLQSNGIIGVDNKNYSIISQEVSTLTARCLF